MLGFSCVAVEMLVLVFVGQPMFNRPTGAALKISIRKKYFQPLFFSVQTCRYGVSYEISSRQISKKSHFLAFYVRFLLFFSCFAGKNASWLVLVLFPIVETILD